MLEIEKIPPQIMTNLKERGHSPEKIARMTSQEAFNECCTWEGLIGWGSTLWRWVDELKKAEKK